MKKIVVFSFLIISTQLWCMNFDPIVRKMFEENLERMVDAGNALQNKEENSAYRIYLDFYRDVKMVGLDAVLKEQKYESVLTTFKEMLAALEKMKIIATHLLMQLLVQNE